MDAHWPPFTRSSEVGQDEYAYRVLGSPNKGTFLDIGSGLPVQRNNSYALEQLGWKGYCVDAGDHAKLYEKERPLATFIKVDARTADWNKILQGTTLIDYLSFDVDESTTDVLRAFPWDRIQFRVITIEHDAYRTGQEPRDEIRDTLTLRGYVLARANVKTDWGKEFEDWFIHPERLPTTNPGLDQCLYRYYGGASNDYVALLHGLLQPYRASGTTIGVIGGAHDFLPAMRDYFHPRSSNVHDLTKQKEKHVDVVIDHSKSDVVQFANFRDWFPRAQRLYVIIDDAQPTGRMTTDFLPLVQVTVGQTAHGFRHGQLLVWVKS